MTLPLQPGQRWSSESEPELGLGSIIRITARTVTVGFPAAGETREYARDNAPLRRVSFRTGDTIKDRSGAVLEVETVMERRGLMYYRGGGREWCETELSDALSGNQPVERLRAGQFDPPAQFDLRMAALGWQHRRRRSALRGFLGGRIDLIPHQLYIAQEVTGRLAPRVLLADEVGLGKTIEAGLIIHRLLLTGRARRVLIVLPESLVHQWFVELLRRFNLWFHIFDEERCAAIEATQPEANPFLDDQWVLCNLRLFTGSGRRLEQALAAGWDLLVVDEAHHLGWASDAVSPEYAAVEALGRAAPGLLLLTATPEQLGLASHFARLRLLDPDRFHDLGAFEREAADYRDVAAMVTKLGASGNLSDAELARFAGWVGEPVEAVGRWLGGAAEGGDRGPMREEWMRALLDRHGTGRVMFRNTRTTIAGFPGRTARLHALPAPAEGGRLLDTLAEEFAADTDPGAAAEFAPDYGRDPRLDWLGSLLRALAPAKVLLICRTLAKVEAIEAALRGRMTLKMAVFHEGLPLVKRDRNAAWFGEEDGARLLLCSEIGSEGRNFQFAHHLVLFDLPFDPELLEQRIGRLDRIGQRSRIEVHVPFVQGSSQEVLARWYHEGLNAFEKNLHGGRTLLEQLGPRVFDLARDYHETSASGGEALPALLRDSRAAREELAVRLEQGRDRLLELNSFRPEAAARLRDGIRTQDADRALDEFMLAMFDHYNLPVEELSPRVYLLGSAGVFADVFPGLPPGGLTVTSDRARALAREEVQFLTWDHPLVTGALDLFLGGEGGNCSFARWVDNRERGLYLEAVYLLECVAPPALHVDRFLPPTPVRVVVDHRLAEASATARPDGARVQWVAGDAHPLWAQQEVREELWPAMLERAEALAGEHGTGLVGLARREMAGTLDRELMRLRALQRVNRSVRAEEITLLEAQRAELDRALGAARLRLDAIRIVQRGPG